jgi:ketosteroid isomerase-like protein
MKKLLLITGIVSFGLLSSAQDNKFTKEINEQVWLPFVKGFSNGDDELFKSVHSKEIVRVSQDDKQIIGYDKYFQKVPDSIKAKWSHWNKNIELRFIQRIASEDKAFEVGYYKSTSTNTKTGEQRTGIGKFHVLLRKENGVWRILMDADTNEGASEETFKKASPMQ